MKKILTLGLTFILLSQTVFAYLDPGTGSVIAGSLWPLILAFFGAVGAFVVKHFWSPIRRGFSKFRKKKGD